MKRFALYLIAAVMMLIAAPARAQAPATMDEFKAIVQDSIRTGQAMKVVQSNIADVEARGQNWMVRFQNHQNNPCYYEEGHPEQCAAYNQEARDLQAEHGRLLEEYNGYVAQMGFYQTHLGVNAARLRLAQFFGTFGPWVERVKGCTRLAWEAATKCLIDAWEVHP